jgi:hypothetical protein
MPLGAYSVIRFTNDLNDQRINLGVIVWHPRDGFSIRWSRALDRVHAVDPTAALQPVKGHLARIEEELKVAGRGLETLAELARSFKEGLAVGAAYPARIHSLEETVDRLYRSLVAPVAEIRRASSQHTFEARVKGALMNVGRVAHAEFKDMGTRRVDGLSVNAGLRTVRSQRRLLWRALSLQAHDHPDRQLAFAKATSLDIEAIKDLGEFRGYKHYVALQSPKPTASEYIGESVSWLKRSADEVLVVRDADALPSLVEKALAAH